MMAYWDEERNCLLNGGGEEGRCAENDELVFIREAERRQRTATYGLKSRKIMR
jgi:hypothetical protein